MQRMKTFQKVEPPSKDEGCGALSFGRGHFYRILRIK